METQREKERQRLEGEARQLDAVWRNPWANLDTRVEAARRAARVARQLGQYPRALQAYQWIEQQAPQSAHVDQAVFETAQTYLQMGQDERATQQLLYLVKQYPQSAWRPVVLYCLGNRQVMYAADLKGAWVYYDQLLREYPHHGLAEETRIYWAQLQQLKPHELRAQVQELHQLRKKHQT